MGKVTARLLNMAKTLPPPKDSELEQFEARIRAAGEWRARLENVVSLAEKVLDNAQEC